MTIDRTSTCCFGGHIPETSELNEPDAKMKLGDEIDRAVADGYTTFISGMSRGADIWAAEIIIRKRHLNRNLKLICAQPYEYFSKDQGWEWNVKYKKIAALADEVVTVSYRSNKGCCVLRNKWMVDRSSRIIAVSDGSDNSNGTLNYAAYRNLKISILEVKRNENVLSQVRKSSV